MSHVIQLSQTQFDALVYRLSRLEKMMAKLIAKDEEPIEGTKEWWEWSDKKALEEYRKGEYYELRNKEELEDFFNHIGEDEYVDKYYSKSKKTRKTSSKGNTKEISQTIGASL